MLKIIAIVCHKVTEPLRHTVNYLSSFENNIILLHVDEKSRLSDFSFLSKENVIILEERIEISWGTDSQIKATLKLMECASNYNFSYFFLISGDDIPVQSNAKIDGFLKKNYGKEFIHYQDFRNEYVDPELRVKYNYPKSFYNRKSSLFNKFVRKFHSIFKDFIFLNRRLHDNKVSLPKFYKGTNWFSLTKSSVEFILDFVRVNPSYLKVYSNSLCADEVFFHTILKTKKDLDVFNDPDAINNALRYIDWKKGPDYPRILDDTDFNEIIKSNSFFARKIKSNESDVFMSSFLKESE